MSTLCLYDVASVDPKNSLLFVQSREQRHFLAHGDTAKCFAALSDDRNMHQIQDSLRSLNSTHCITEGSLDSFL